MTISRYGHSMVSLNKNETLAIFGGIGGNPLAIRKEIDTMDCFDGQCNWFTPQNEISMPKEYSTGFGIPKLLGKCI